MSHVRIQPMPAWSRGYGCYYGLYELLARVSKKDSLSDEFCVHEGLTLHCKQTASWRKILTVTCYKSENFTVGDITVDIGINCEHDVSTDLSSVDIAKQWRWLCIGCCFEEAWRRDEIPHLATFMVVMCFVGGEAALAVGKGNIQQANIWSAEILLVVITV